MRPNSPVNWRRRILLSTWYALLWGVIAATMAAARGLFRHTVLPQTLAPGPAAWDLVRVPLGMFAVVFAGCFALGLAGISLRFDARWLIRNRRALWIAWALLLLVLIVMYAVASRQNT